LIDASSVPIPTTEVKEKSKAKNADLEKPIRLHKATVESGPIRQTLMAFLLYTKKIMIS
jgi:hypothetical protein